MSLILNESSYVENVILKNGEVGNKPSSTLFLLAKYYYNHDNISKEQIAIKLNEFMQKNYPNYNEVFWENIIDSISSSANKFLLNELDGVPITMNELNVIGSLNDDRLERYLFSMLCYAKAYNLLFEKNDGWINTDLSIIYNVARLRSRNSDDRFHLVNQLLHRSYIINGKESPIISVSKKNTNRNVKLNFLDLSGEKELFISDFRELGYEYLLYKGGKFIRCDKCGKLIRKIGTKKYCPDCLNDNPYYDPIETKIIKCIDCGKELEVDSKDTKTERCNDCYIKYRRIYKAQKEKNRRKSKCVDRPILELVHF